MTNLYAQAIRFAHVHSRVAEKDLMSKKRHDTIAKARWLAMAWLRDKGQSYSAIGRMMNMDHSSIIYGVRSVKKHYDEIMEGYRQDI